MRENQEQIRARQNQTNIELERMKVQITEIERKHDVINGKVDQLNENVNQVKQAQAEIKRDQVAFKDEMRQQFQTVTDLLNQLLQGPNRNIRPQPPEMEMEYFQQLIKQRLSSWVVGTLQEETQY
ncbi:uncharacterized protein LOC114517741 [Dendronephthya gigantea]|uniref:uncharacterized protein LOC114517741 n=1 Tax=Dendronephthya gigantea TaxID=151771 RepID=UPI001069682C|nr:uncharacterized protein LOC114517741 [Dendronephthya gigantea]